MKHFQFTEKQLKKDIDFSVLVTAVSSIKEGLWN
jgi:hypothetical protein